MDNNDYREEQQNNQQNGQQDNQQSYQQSNQQGYQQGYQQNNQQGYQQGNWQNNYGHYPPPPPPFKQQYYYQPKNTPPYNPNQQYYYNQPELTNSKNFAIASLVLGILSIITCEGIAFPIVCGVLALIFGMKSKKEIPIGFPGRKLANAGYVLSIIGLSLTALSIFGRVTSFMAECYWHF